MITKGALHSILAICSRVEESTGRIVPLEGVRERVVQRYEYLSGEGYRVLGVCSRSEALQKHITREDEGDMIFSGFLVLYDPPKENIGKTIDHIRRLGVSLKIITGDSSLVASHMAVQVGISRVRALTGNELRAMNDEALVRRVGETDIFAEVEPAQKERIILALKKAGNVVGYMGDGINDATALHAADVGISVDSAVDVAKEAADIVLLDKDLSVLVHGIQEGRKTFSNTMKYVFMATSANFGNMFSMAGASLFLPFLPLLPKQILLTNLLTDVPEMTIAADNVDPEKIQKPQRWDIGFIRRFMLTFGMLSSAFDFATFAVLFFVLKASTEQFRSGWFIESVMSATCIVLVIRTPKFFLKSRPHRYLVLATLLIAAVAVAIPYSPLAKLFSFHALPPIFLLIVVLIIIAYVFAAELTKRIFYGKLR
jgi:Mg2+-importing ATPase